MNIVALVSGGLDSVTMAHEFARDGHAVDVIAADYGQRHRCELEYAARCAEAIGARFDLVDLSALGALLTGSALTDGSVAVPDGHYAAPSMRQTVVPNRNAILLSVAYAAAVARGADAVGYAAHTGDHYVYLDCRPLFVGHFEAAMWAGNEPQITLLTPFITFDKARIVALADRLGVPLAETWSCYRGGDRHCGTCGTCVERREAFAVAKVQDPTEYAR